MHLINPLVAGIRGAEIGSVELLERGTSTHAVYYKDFPASQQYSAQPIPLDSFGSATIYVDELVDVLVHDQNGVLVRQFVAGDYAAAVEVISQSFTGTDYRDGTIGPFKPTNLASVLDLWKTNAGAIDWKVLVGGLPVTIGEALSSFAAIYYNVKSYGALGNGVADDGAAITAAVAAAAVAGGTVYFPPGVYRVTGMIISPANVSWLGNGGSSSKVAFDSAGATTLISWSGTDTGMRTVRGLWFGSINTFHGATLLAVTGAGARIAFEECLIGGDTLTVGLLMRTDHNTVKALVTFTRCVFSQAGDAFLILQNGAPPGRITFRDCDFIIARVGTSTNPLLVISDGVLVDGCYFDASLLTGGPNYYVAYGQLGAFGGCVFTNNRFRGSAAMVGALHNSAASPNNPCWESGNSTTGFLPLYNDTPDGYADVVMDSVGLRTHGSRTNRVFGTVNDLSVVNLDGENCGIGIIKRTGLGAQTITTNLGSLGDPFMVQIINGTGSPLIPVFGAGFSTPAGSMPSIPIGGKGQYQFMFLPSSTGTVGAFQLMGQAVSA